MGTDGPKPPAPFPGWEGGDVGAHRDAPSDHGEPTMPTLAVIVAARNEAQRIAAVLRHYRELAPDAGLIVADGASRDATVREALPYARVVTGRGSLGANQNLAAAEATADVLLFVHADTHLA